MENLYSHSQVRIRSVNKTFGRYLMEEINWNERLIAISGARGSGKTTLMLQYINENIRGNVLYISLDDIYFSKNRLFDVADDFAKTGGKFLFIDEIHKYPDWSREIKNIYDIYDKLRMVISGSSALEIDKGAADLSRRAVRYNLHELSLREYLQLIHKISLPAIPIEEILQNHTQHAGMINKIIKPISIFREFLEFGAYPYIVQGKSTFNEKLKSTVNIAIEQDLPSSFKISYESVHKLKKLLMVISDSVPFKPNISELSIKVGTSRDQLLKYLDLLCKARLINMLMADSNPSGYLTKPEKIYLNNSSLMFALSEKSPDIGTLRETFFLQHLSQKHRVLYSGKGDFLADNKYTFEIGGKDKSFKQVRGMKNAFVVADNIEYGHDNKIPLWLFGFLY